MDQHPNHAPAMTWHQHLKDVHAHLKKTNPNATLKQAMLEGRGSYRAMKDRLYDARQHMVSVAREDIKKHRYGPPPRALVDRADRIESHAAADVLAMMKHDNIPKRLKFH